jgi:hypothetical protein
MVSNPFTITRLQKYLVTVNNGKLKWLVLLNIVKLVSMS